MFKTKKSIIRGFISSLAMVATPIAAVVSCAPGKEIKIKKEISNNSKYTVKKEAIKELKMDPFCVVIKQDTKGQSVSEYKASVINFIKSHYEKSKGKEFTDADLKTVTDATTSNAIKTAAAALVGIKKEIKEVNTIFTINGKDYDMDGFVSLNELLNSNNVIEWTNPGHKAFKAVPGIVGKYATLANPDNIKAEIEAAKTKEDVYKILKKYTLDNKNQRDVNTGAIDSIIAMSVIKPSAESLIDGWYNRDAVEGKPEIAAKKEQPTVITLNKKDKKQTKVKVKFDRFVEKSSLHLVTIIKVLGRAGQEATDTLAKIGQKAIKDITSLDDYAQSLISLFIINKTIFADKEKKISFKEDDEFMKTITDAAAKKGATGATVLAAAKAVKFFR